MSQDTEQIQIFKNFVHAIGNDITKIIFTVELMAGTEDFEDNKDIEKLEERIEDLSKKVSDMSKHLLNLKE